MAANGGLPGSRFTGSVAQGIRTAMMAHLSGIDGAEVNAIVADLRETYGNFAVEMTLAAFEIESGLYSWLIGGDTMKPIDQVMADAADLVEIRHTLRQIVNVKGD